MIITHLIFQVDVIDNEDQVHVVGLNENRLVEQEKDKLLLSNGNMIMAKHEEDVDNDDDNVSFLKKRNLSPRIINGFSQQQVEELELELNDKTALLEDGTAMKASQAQMPGKQSPFFHC